MKHIEIAYCDKTLTVEAHVIGKFAVHTPDGSPFKGWPANAWYRISHIASGRAVTEAPGLARIKALAKQIDALVPDMDFSEADWTGEWSDRYRAFVEAARPLAIEARQEAH